MGQLWSWTVITCNRCKQPIGHTENCSLCESARRKHGMYADRRIRNGRIEKIDDVGVKA